MSSQSSLNFCRLLKQGIKKPGGSLRTGGKRLLQSRRAVDDEELRSERTWLGGYSPVRDATYGKNTLEARRIAANIPKLPGPDAWELRTDAGPIDAVFINERGRLTIVECKLWKNPEAVRISCTFCGFRRSLAHSRPIGGAPRLP
jgi:hypothetical protein